MKFLNNMDGASKILEDSSHRFVTDAEKAAWNAKQAAITGGASSIVSSDLSASRALVSSTSGKVAVSGITLSELERLDGARSNLQDQIDAKASSTHSHSLFDLSDVYTVAQMAGHVLYYDGTEWRNTTPSGAGLQTTITGGATTIASSNLTASRALISDANGKVAVSAVTSTELGYLDGVTSAIQTQLNGKAASSHTHSYLPLTGGTLTGSLTLTNGDVFDQGLLYNEAGKITSSAITKADLEGFFLGFNFAQSFEEIRYSFATYGEFYDFQQEVYNEYSHYTHSHIGFTRNTGVAVSSLNATSSSTSAWNYYDKYNLMLENSNNALVFTVGGVTNDRKAIIQVGHNSNSYASALGTLQLNPFGGAVTVNGKDISTTDHTHSSMSLTGDPLSYASTVIAGVNNAPFNLPTVNVGTTARFIPFGHMAAMHSQGYVSHLSFGLYKSTTTWVNGFFIGLGGADANPTEYYMLNHGGSIQHSSGLIYMSSQMYVNYDHTSASSPRAVGVIMGTGNPPTASTVPQGTIYLKYA